MVRTFAASQGLEFYIPANSRAPDFIVRLGNVMHGSCRRDLSLGQGDTGEISNGWRKIYFPLSSFECTGNISLESVNRVLWESRGSGMTDICVKNIRLVLKDQQVAGR